VRCIFDTNTLISALLFENSVPGRAFYLVLAEGDILISSETVEELVEVLNRRKFDKYLTKAERETFLVALLDRGEFVEVSSDVRICRDSEDNKFLNLACDGNADFIISGDEDLLVLQTHNNTRILSAKDFLDLISA